VLRIGLCTDCQIRFLFPIPRKRRVEVVDRFVSLVQSSRTTQKNTKETSYVRGVISSLVFSRIHQIPLYRCLQGIYGMSPSGHIYIWYEPINPLIEEFLTSETHKRGCDIGVERGCANISLGRYLLRSTRYPHHIRHIVILTLISYFRHYMVLNFT
jgi:hypothetical protein